MGGICYGWKGLRLCRIIIYGEPGIVILILLCWPETRIVEYIGLIGGGLHNFYLQTAVMLGIVVLLFYIGLLTVVLRVKLRKADKSMYRLLIGMKSFIWAVVFLAFF